MRLLSLPRASLLGVGTVVAVRGRAVLWHLDTVRQQARYPLDVDGVVLLMDLLQGVRHYAKIAPQLADHRRDLLGIRQHLDRLRIRVVAYPERSLNLIGERAGERKR